MRTIHSLAVLTLLLCATGARASAAAPAHVEVRGDALALYPFGDGTTLLAADGHVVLRASHRTIRADALRYDLATNRVVAAGHVIVARDARPPLEGAAYALDLVAGTATLLRLGAQPQTLALSDDDLARAVERPADASTFAIADLSGERPYIRGKRASIAPNANVRMSPAAFSTGAGPPFETPTYLYTFARTNFSVSSLPYATFDQPYPLFGTANSLTSAHVRYDSQNGESAGFDERLVHGNDAYAVASLLPIRADRFDLSAFQQIKRGFTQNLSGFHEYGPFRNNSLAYQLQWTSPSSRTTLAATEYDESNHLTLTVSTLDHFLAPFFTYRLQAGYGYEHTPHVQPFSNAFDISAGGYVATPTVRGPLGIGTSLRYNYTLTSYDFPHEVTNGALTFTFSHVANRSLSFLGTVAFQQTADRYRDNAGIYLGLPDPSEPFYAPDGTPYPGYFAYAGLNTLRTYSLQTTWRPRGGENSLQLYLTHARDFPQFHGLGRPPLYATLDVTERLGSTLRVDLARSYAFGWDQRYFSQWSVGISP